MKRETRVGTSLSRYYRDIRSYEPLDREREHQLALRIESGDDDAIEELVRSHLGFVVKVAREYQHLGLPFEDLLNEGNIGLIEAAKRFDSSRDNKFISYAVWWIRRTILKAVSDHSTTVRIPVSHRRKMRYEREEERLATREEKQLGLPVKSRLQRRQETPCPHSALPSLRRIGLDDFETSERMMSMREILTDDRKSCEDSLIDQQAVENVSLALDVLTDLEREVIDRRYGFGEHQASTLQEIGDELNYTREWVRQIELKAKRKLRKEMARQTRIPLPQPCAYELASPA